MCGRSERQRIVKSARPRISPPAASGSTIKRRSWRRQTIRAVEIYANLGSPDLAQTQATLRECEGW